MGLVLITHDMGVVAETAHRVQVMYAGQTMETQPTAGPVRHAASSLHRSAALAHCPSVRWGDRACRPFQAWCPGIDDRPDGCLFHPRCSFATQHCIAVRPTLEPVPRGAARCHYALDDAGRPPHRRDTLAA